MNVLRNSRGLTLIELLLALAIFSILASLAYGGLNSVLNTREAVTAQSKRLADVQRSFVRLARDLGQVAPRAIRDIHGDVQPAIHSGIDTYNYVRQDFDTGEDTEYTANVLIEFTVAGKRLLPNQRRSTLQRVAYAVNDKELLRLNWSVLDRAQDSQPYVTVILSDIEDVAFRYLGSDGEWHDEWSNSDTVILELPVAVEVSFKVEQWGELRRVFLVS